MTQPPGAQIVCPFLGLPDDPVSRFWMPDSAHRCWSGAGQPVPIDIAYQSAKCMTGTYPTCARFKDRERPTAGPFRAATTTATSPRVTLGGRDFNRPSTRVLGLVGILAIAVLGTLLLLAGGFFGGSRPPVAFATPSPQPTGTLGPTQTPQPTATALPTPTPLASPTPAPSPIPTPTVAPKPSPAPIIHTVVKGETLRSIARLYDVTVEEIMVANGLTNRNRIYIGQQLLIPVQ